MLKYILFFISSLIVQFFPFAQDTIVYRQANASLFSNNYYLIKTNPNDKQGIFYRFLVTDDLHYRYGEGIFKENNRIISLRYDTTKCTNRIEYISYPVQSDTVSIQWNDCWGDHLSFFTIRAIDSSNNIKKYESYLDTLKIPKTELINKRLSLHRFATAKSKLADFDMRNDADEIIIYARDTIMSSTFDTTKEKLKKNKYGFKAKGEFLAKKRKNQKTQFVTQDDNSAYIKVISDPSRLSNYNSIQKQIALSIQKSFNWKNVSEHPYHSSVSYQFHFSKNGKFKKITSYFDSYPKKPEDNFFTGIQLYFWKITDPDYRFQKKIIRKTKKTMKDFPKIEKVKIFKKKSKTKINLWIKFHPIQKEIEFEGIEFDLY